MAACGTNWVSPVLGHAVAPFARRWMQRCSTCGSFWNSRPTAPTSQWTIFDTIVKWTGPFYDTHEIGPACLLVCVLRLGRANGIAGAVTGRLVTPNFPILDERTNARFFVASTLEARLLSAARESCID